MKNAAVGPRSSFRRALTQGPLVDAFPAFTRSPALGGRRADEWCGGAMRNRRPLRETWLALHPRDAEMEREAPCHVGSAWREPGGGERATPEAPPCARKATASDD